MSQFMKRISDEDLLERQFRYEDPEGIAGLCRDRPDSTLDPEIVGFYKVRPSGGLKANSTASYVWCCHCQKQTHWDGRVLQDRSGGTYIIGVDCGRKHYGDKFVAIDRAFDDQLQRQGLLRRWSDLLDLKPALLADLEVVLGDAIWREIDAKRQEVRKVAPDLIYRLKPVVKRGGPLILRRRIRDHDAEARRARSFQRAMEQYRSLSKFEKAEARRDGLKPERDDTPIFQNVEENLGHAVGTAIITDDGDVRSCVVTLKKLLAELAPVNHISAAKNAELSRSLRAISEAVRSLREAFVETSSAWRFFTAENMDRIERWYASIKPTPFVAGGGAGEPTTGPLSDIAALERKPFFLPPALDHFSAGKEQPSSEVELPRARSSRGGTLNLAPRHGASYQAG